MMHHDGVTNVPSRNPPVRPDPRSVTSRPAVASRPGPGGHPSAELIADSIPHIVWTAAADGSTTYFNRRGVEYTGCPRRDQLRVELGHPRAPRRRRPGPAGVGTRHENGDRVRAGLPDPPPRRRVPLALLPGPAAAQRGGRRRAVDRHRDRHRGPQAARALPSTLAARGERGVDLAAERRGGRARGREAGRPRPADRAHQPDPGRDQRPVRGGAHRPDCGRGRAAAVGQARGRLPASPRGSAESATWT